MDKGDGLPQVDFALVTDRDPSVVGATAALVVYSAVRHESTTARSECPEGVEPTRYPFSIALANTLLAN